MFNPSRKVAFRFIDDHTSTKMIIRQVFARHGNFSLFPARLQANNNQGEPQPLNQLGHSAAAMQRPFPPMIRRSDYQSEILERPP
jgi:hypothetical protein